MYIEKTRNYWSTRNEGYSDLINEELNSEKKEIWLNLINKYRPKGDSLKILDAGCGPGFFPVLLGMEGHHVTAVDYTEEMLETTKKNVEKYGVEKNVEIIRQDIHNLIFEDETFDMVISRNVTWTIDDPHKVYGEWLRVLKPGGCFLNFDSNFLFSLYDEELQKQYKEDEKEAISQGYEPVPNDHLADGMDEVLPNLPTAKGRRPGWDVNQLMDYEFNNILIDKNVHEGLLSGFDEILHRNSKMFLLRVEK